MEEWRDIEGYEGLYQVSNEGRVKSLERYVEWRGTIKHQSERILKPLENNRGGYLVVCLCKNSKVKTYTVHRLVASAFIENYEELPCVNHKDEDKTNNNVDNLEWCTYEYNINYGNHNKRVSEALKGFGKDAPKPWVSEALSIPINMLTKDNEFVRQFPSSKEAMRWLRINGFPKASDAHINHCNNGKRKTAYGYKWRYA